MFGFSKKKKVETGIKIYFVWITALTTEYLDSIIAAMLSRGYMVGAIDKNGRMVSGALAERPATSVISFAVYKRNGSPLTATIVHDDLIYVMDEVIAFYYSIVVSNGGEATWIGSNFSLNQPEAEEYEVDLSELNNTYDRTMN